MHELESNERSQSICDLLGKLPPNYTLGTIYLNGQPVTVAKFSNLNNELAYFIDDNNQVVILDCNKIDGIAFATAEADAHVDEE